MSVSPVPTTGNTIDATINDPLYPNLKLTYKVSDWDGNELFSGNADGTGFSVDISALIPGTYILTANDGFMTYGKHFIKQ